MATSCGYEFQLKHFGFTDCKPIKFQTLQWTNCRFLFLLYRIFTFTFQLGWLVAGCIARSEIYFFKLSNWCMLYSTIYYGFACISAIHGFAVKNQKKEDANANGFYNKALEEGTEDFKRKLSNSDTEGERSLKNYPVEVNLRWFHKVTWIFQTMAMDTVFLVTAVYWIAVFPNEDAAERDIHGYAKHAFNFGLLFIDMFLVHTPVRFLHVIYMILISVCYSVFLVIVHFAGLESAAYGFTNFEKDPGLAAGVLSSITFVGSIVFHSFWFGIYHLRSFLRKLCGGESKE